MAMNSSGPISLAGVTAGVSIEIENGGNGTTQISLNDTAVRNLAGVASGQITMPTDFYGKANRVAISYTFSANTADASLNLSSISGYSSGKSDITVTINSGVYLYATSTSGYGLNITGGTTGDTLTIVNNGYIMGKGGTGGGGDNRNIPANAQGASGGTALNFGFGLSSATVNNTNASAYIGGGGGGGGGTFSTGGSAQAGGGGGAGGGNGGYAYDDTMHSGGSGGGIGSSGSDAPADAGRANGGGGGGRIFPGTGGAGITRTNFDGAVNGKGGGSGGSGAFGSANNKGGSSTSGSGGSANAVGGNASASPTDHMCGGGGGGWGASGGTGTGSTSTPQGGAGGKAVNLNGKSITWTSGNTTRVYGAVS